MKKLLLLLFTSLVYLYSNSQVHVSGYTRSNGTYVAPYTRSSPNSTKTDNYNYSGNTYPSTQEAAAGNIVNEVNELYYNKTPVNSNRVWVKGYYKKNGTYVEGYYRTAPNKDPMDNYSYPGNTNPITGKTANGNPDNYLKKYHVNSSLLNIRSGPSTNYQVLTTIGFGETVEVVETINSHWKKVMVNSILGYVYSPNLTLSNDENNLYYSIPQESNIYTYLKKSPSDSTTIYVNAKTLNLRDGASSNSKILATLSIGTSMKVIDLSINGWTKVSLIIFEGGAFTTKTGYVFTEYTAKSYPLNSNLIY